MITNIHSDVIINENVLNKPNNIFFVLLCFFVFFSEKTGSHLYLFLCECQFLEPYIQYRKNKYLFDLGKNIPITSFYQDIMTAFRVDSIVKYCYLVFFIDSIAFTSNKRPKLAFGKLVLQELLLLNMGSIFVFSFELFLVLHYWVSSFSTKSYSLFLLKTLNNEGTQSKHLKPPCSFHTV